MIDIKLYTLSLQWLADIVNCHGFRSIQ